MPPIAQALALVAALLHVGFFYLESIAFARPRTWARFGLATQAEADVVRPMAFNQGFYNLFLALGVVAGLVLIDFASGGAVSAGIGITKFSLGLHGPGRCRPAGHRPTLPPGGPPAGRATGAGPHRQRDLVARPGIDEPTAPRGIERPTMTQWLRVSLPSARVRRAAWDVRGGRHSEAGSAPRCTSPRRRRGAHRGLGRAGVNERTCRRGCRPSGREPHR